MCDNPKSACKRCICVTPQRLTLNLHEKRFQLIEAGTKVENLHTTDAPTVRLTGSNFLEAQTCQVSNAVTQTPACNMPIGKPVQKSRHCRKQPPRVTCLCQTRPMSDLHEPCILHDQLFQKIAAPIHIKCGSRRSGTSSFHPNRYNTSSPGAYSPN